MVQEIDNYGVARLFVKEYGDSAIDEVKHNISKYAALGDSCSLKRWYEVELAVNDILCSAEEKASV
jgi:hypothetical protein